MAEKKFVSISGESKLRYIRPSLLAEQGTTGVILEGVYNGPVPNTLDASKSDYKFTTDGGEEVIVNSAGSLAYKMAKVQPGSLVRLVYNGMDKIKTGNKAGKMAHNFDVQIAADETLASAAE